MPMSPTFFSPRITLSHPPSFSSIQPSQSAKRRNNIKTRSTSYRNPANFPCFSSKIPSSTTHSQNSSCDSSSPNNPDDDFSDTESVNSWVDADVLASWLQSCYSLKEVRKIHAVVMKCLGSSVVYVDNNLISAYLRFGKLTNAHKVFNEMSERNVVSWTAVLNGYFRFGLDDEALRLFSDFIENGVRANGKTFVCVLNLCSKKLDYELGRQIHGCILKGNWSNLIVDSAVVYFYAQCGDLLGAFRAFERMPQRDVVCWTTMITACSQQGHGKEAFSMFFTNADRWIFS
ncbi:hypothetical protein L1049_026736 [Liquidambar formosana]|uniref:Pentatricopeptide repeat-containing protein n=1 Tax=Liquidambar formosana TaxID=63359 RepID=A0AAP0NFE6_LIQFO